MKGEPRPDDQRGVMRANAVWIRQPRAPQFTVPEPIHCILDRIHEVRRAADRLCQVRACVARRARNACGLRRARRSQSRQSNVVASARIQRIAAAAGISVS